MMNQEQPRRRLSELLQSWVQLQPDEDVTVADLSMDSRCAKSGDLFVAVGGSSVHGAKFIPEAMAKGVAAVVTDNNPVDSRSAVSAAYPGVPVIHVADLHAKLGQLAQRFFHPAPMDLEIIGVTGTNGKSSCAYFLAQCLHTAQQPCGLVGTLGYGLFAAIHPSNHTTPNVVELHRLLSQFHRQGAKYMVMEVSSHGLDQGRVDAVDFRVALFTNLSHDHLDYHKTMAAYGQAKQRLFEMPGLKYAIINVDDEFGRELCQRIQGQTAVIAVTLNAQVLGGDAPVIYANHIESHGEGTRFDLISPWGKATLAVALLGQFNVRNLLTVFGALCCLNMPFNAAVAKISQVTTVPGRMERFGAKGQPLVVVDYAHSPDALANVLQALCPHLGPQAQLWCVFGCGGDRDVSKRPLMGAIAEQFAHRVILTDDNPRSENGQDIIKQILQGCVAPQKVMVQRDRRQAIQYAISRAKVHDVVLVAGKGHEEYQQIGTHRIPFSDRQVVPEILKEWAP